MSRKNLVLSVGVVVLIVSVAAAVELGYISTGGAGRPDGAATAEPLAIDFDAVDLEGQPFHGIDLKGRIVLLDFWAVWCRPCLEAFPKLTKLAHDLEHEPFDLMGVALYSGDHDDVREFLTEYDADYPMVVGEDDLAFRYGVIGYPTYFLIDPEGGIFKKYVGALPGLEDRVKADVLQLKKEYGLDS